MGVRCWVLGMSAVCRPAPTTHHLSPITTHLHVEQIVAMSVDDLGALVHDDALGGSVATMRVAVKENARMIGVDQVGEGGEAPVSAVRGVETGSTPGLAW